MLSESTWPNGYGTQGFLCKVMTRLTQSRGIGRLIAQSRIRPPGFYVVNFKGNVLCSAVLARPFITSNNQLPERPVSLGVHFRLPQVRPPAAPVAIIDTTRRVLWATVHTPDASRDIFSVAIRKNPTVKGSRNLSSLTSWELPSRSGRAARAGSRDFSPGFLRFGWIGGEVREYHAARLGTEAPPLSDVVLPTLSAVAFKPSRHTRC